jgi:G3E family GTPase
MGKQNLMLFNGFLGSGKTTTMIETAKCLHEKGIKVSLITNDLGENLVDSHLARFSGIPVAEIPKICFCHDVDGFIKTIRDLKQSGNPDFIFAEPVGSCVDLVRSVYMVLNSDFSDEVSLLPFVSVVDPFRYQSIYMDESSNTYNEEATYMLKKQIEDADILLLNKCDLITAQQKDAILDSMRKNFPEKEILPISALNHDNFSEWTKVILSEKKPSLRPLDIDWDYLFAGEEHIGWYNSVLGLESTAEVDYNDFLNTLMENIQARFAKKNWEIAHLKILCSSKDELSKATLTSTNQKIFFSNKFSKKYKDVACNINIRAIAGPQEIAKIINDAILESTGKHNVKVSRQIEQSFNHFETAPEPVIAK